MSDEIADNRQFAEMIGLITMHWNKLHDLVRHCFPAALGGDATFTGPILDVLKSDDTERRVVLAAITAVFGTNHHTALRQRASDLFNRIGKLSGQRNGFIHSSWTRTNGAPLEPSDTMKKVHGSLKDDPLAQGQALLREISSLHDEVFDLIIQLQTASSR